MMMTSKDLVYFSIYDRCELFNTVTCIRIRCNCLNSDVAYNLFDILQYHNPFWLHFKVLNVLP